MSDIDIFADDREPSSGRFKRGSSCLKKNREAGVRIGRPPKEITALVQQCVELFHTELSRIIGKDVSKLARHYLKRCYTSDLVLRHAVDKLMPDMRPQAAPTRGIAIAFLDCRGRNAESLSSSVSVIEVEPQLSETSDPAAIDPNLPAIEFQS